MHSLGCTILHRNPQICYATKAQIRQGTDDYTKCTKINRFCVRARRGRDGAQRGAVSIVGKQAERYGYHNYLKQRQGARGLYGGYNVSARLKQGASDIFWAWRGVTDGGGLMNQPIKSARTQVAKWLSACFGKNGRYYPRLLALASIASPEVFA